MSTEYRYKKLVTAWNGISNYLASNFNGYSKTEAVNKAIRDFIKSNNLPYDNRGNSMSESNNAETVSKNWALFIKYQESNPQHQH